MINYPSKKNMFVGFQYLIVLAILICVIVDIANIFSLDTSKITDEAQKSKVESLKAATIASIVLAGTLILTVGFKKYGGKYLE